MLLINTNQPFSNTNLPAYAPSADEKLLAGLPGLSFWLEGDSASDKFFKTSGSAFLAWVDRVAGRQFVPAAAGVPIIKSAGSRKALQFGYGAGLSGSINLSGYLKAEDNADILGAQSYTYGLVFNIPAFGGSGPAATGGTLFGNRYAATAFRLATAYNTDHLQLRNGGTVLTAANSDGVHINEGTWHTAVVSYDFTSKVAVIRTDGVERKRGTGAVSDMASASGALKLLIGANGEPASAPYVGDIGALIGFGRALFQTPAELAALEAHLATIKAGLSS